LPPLPSYGGTEGKEAKPEGKGNKAKSLPQPENESLTTKLVV